MIQFFLYFLLILLSFFFYKKYFDSNELNKINDTKKNDISSLENQNNLIKNLKYEVKFDDDTQYTITAELSELIYKTEIDNIVEYVQMQKVKAKFVDTNNNQLIINSDNAEYNNSNYNTKFFNNVKIQYMDNVINANNLDLNFTENFITIYNNVVYEGLQGLVKTDNITIDLVTKNIEIFMNNSKNKVEVISK